MKKHLIATRESLKWMTLVAIVVAIVFVVTRGNREPPQAKTALSASRRATTAVPHANPTVKHRTVWPKDVDLQDAQTPAVTRAEDIQPDKRAPAGPSGFETPPPETTSNQSATSTANDPATLCGALRSAYAAGRGSEISVIRTHLLALGPDAISAVSDLLRCGTESVEVEAVRLLVQIGDSNGMALALGKLLTVSRESHAYGLLLAAFADNHSPAVAQWLSNTLGTTMYADTRQRMFDLLYTMRGPATVAALEQAALNPTDKMHAQDSLNSIALRQDPSETETLAALMESHDTMVREAAAYGLANVGSGHSCLILAGHAKADPVSAGALAMVSSSYAQETLLAVAADPARPPTVRTSAIQALSGQSGFRVETVLANASAQEQNSVVAETLQAALTTIQNNQTESRHPLGNESLDKVEEVF